MFFKMRKISKLKLKLSKLRAEQEMINNIFGNSNKIPVFYLDKLIENATKIAEVNHKLDSV